MTWAHGALIFAGAALALGALALPACVDTSPADYHAPGPVDAGGFGDGAAPDASGTLAEACRACITTGACVPQYTACKANSKCGIIGDCWLDTYCLNWDTQDLTHLPPCALTCATKGGVTSQDDPAVMTIGDLVECAQDPLRCGPVCDVRAP